MKKLCFFVGSILLLAACSFQASVYDEKTSGGGSGMALPSVDDSVLTQVCQGVGNGEYLSAQSGHVSGVTVNYYFIFDLSDRVTCYVK